MSVRSKRASEQPVTVRIRSGHVVFADGVARLPGQTRKAAATK
ncbi:MAG: hypothetical protein ACXVZL_11725 [Gaiellaceae bacterium]